MKENITIYFAIPYTKSLGEPYRLAYLEHLKVKILIYGMIENFKGLAVRVLI